jgi:hypothetical protein
MSVADGLASALGNAAGPKTGWRCLGLFLAAWHETPAMLKMVRLAEHIQWAEKHNALPEVAAISAGSAGK